MAANGGLAGSSESDARDQGDECLQQPASSSQTMNERHLRIVYSADGPGGFSRAAPRQQSRRPAHASPASGEPPQSGGMLDRSIQGQIGRMLRDVFSDVASEPVPTRFIELLEALGTQEEQK